MQTSSSKRNAYALPFILIGISFFVAIAFTKDTYQSYLTKQDDLVAINQQAVEKKRQLDALNAIKDEALTQSGIRQDIERYASPYREDQIIDSIFLNTPGITINAITMTKGEKLPSGLSQATVTLNFRASDIATLSTYLDTLTASTGKKRYIIRSLSFPLDTSSLEQTDPLGVSLELATYFLE